MTIKNHMTALAVTAGLLISVSTARAARPLDVDCDLLAVTNDAVNVFLDVQGVQFDNRCSLRPAQCSGAVVFRGGDRL